jgi:uncharacterized membrane protein YdjX (TVP38/TMEM64 family)
MAPGAGVQAESQAGWRLKFVVCGLAVAGLVLLARHLDAPSVLRDALDAIARLGVWGPVLFLVLYVAATVFFLPGSILTIGAGAVFGLARGFVVVSASATLGATAAFLVGRYVARGLVARKVERHPKFKAIDDAVAREGWKIVALLRLSPVVPFNVLNYAFGLTRVPLRHYVLASWVGMMPGTLMYVYLGSIAGDLAGAGPGRAQRTPAEWALYGVGLAATIAVTVLVTRLARRALDARAHLTGLEDRPRARGANAPGA